MSDISHAEFAMIAARLAQKAAGWTADCLILADQRESPMKADSLTRFTDEMLQMVEACNGR